jgi:hypothetical protein
MRLLHVLVGGNILTGMFARPFFPEIFYDGVISRIKYC